MAFTDYLSSVFGSSTYYAEEAKQEEEPPKDEKAEDDDAAAAEEPEAEAEAEEEEPEDEHPAIREHCQQSKECSGFTKHFEHCTEKVAAGKGYQGEDCVEELMMHCVDACIAPKLFSKLR